MAKKARRKTKGINEGQKAINGCSIYPARAIAIIIIAFISIFSQSNTIRAFEKLGEPSLEPDDRYAQDETVPLPATSHQAPTEQYLKEEDETPPEILAEPTKEEILSEGRAYYDDSSGFTVVLDKNGQAISGIDQDGNIYKRKENGHLAIYYGRHITEEGNVYIIENFQYTEMISPEGNIYRMQEGRLKPYQGVFIDTGGNQQIINEFQSRQIISGGKAYGIRNGKMVPHAGYYTQPDSGVTYSFNNNKEIILAVDKDENIYKMREGEDEEGNKEEKLTPYFGQFKVKDEEEKEDIYMINNFNTVQITKADGNIYKLKEEEGEEEKKLAAYQGTFTQEDGSQYQIEEFELSQVTYPDGQVNYYKKIAGETVIDRVETSEGQVSNYHYLYQEGKIKIDYMERSNGNIYKLNEKGELALYSGNYTDEEGSIYLIYNFRILQLTQTNGNIYRMNSEGQLVPYQGTFLTAEGEEVILENGRVVNR